MISGISKKVIFFSFLFIKCIQPSKSAELPKFNTNTNNQNIKISLSNVSNLDISSNSQNHFLKNDLDDGNNYVKFLKNNTYSLSVAKAENQQELIIESDKQSEISGVIYAEGNVSVSYKGKLLKADKLIYDSQIKKLKQKEI